MENNAKNKLNNYELRIGVVNSYTCLLKQEHIPIEVINFIKETLFKELRVLENTVEDIIKCRKCKFKGKVSSYNYTVNRMSSQLKRICPKCKETCEVI